MLPILALLFTFLIQAGAEPVMIWISSQQDKEYYDKMVEQYQEKVDENFEAEVQAYGFTEVPDKFAVAVKSGQNVPDIVQLDAALFGSFLRGEPPFLDLTDRLKAKKLDKDLMPERLALFQWKDKTYGLPQSVSAMVLYYRTDLFKKFDLKPDDFATWEKLHEIGQDIKEEHSVFTMSLDPTYFEALLLQRGSDLFGKDGKPFPDMEKAASTLEFLVKLHKDEVATMPERGSIFDPLFFSSQVENDEVLTILGADWYGLDHMTQFAPILEGKWGIMPMPAWEKDGCRTSCFAGQGLCIYKDSPRKEAAWKFIEWVMTDKEANLLRYEMGNSFPAYKPVWKEKRLLAETDYFKGSSMGKTIIAHANKMPTPVMHPNRPKALFLMNENYFSMAIYEVKSPRETLEDFAEQLKED